MDFNVRIWPIYGFMLGVNWSKTEYLGEDLTVHELQVAFGLVILEFVWES
jgi:hypothetical protein